jgi:hypothetical protein
MKAYKGFIQFALTITLVFPMSVVVDKMDSSWVGGIAVGYLAILTGGVITSIGEGILKASDE